MEPPKDPQNCTQRAWGTHCLQAASGNFSTKGIGTRVDKDNRSKLASCNYITKVPNRSSSVTNLVARRGELVDAPGQLPVGDGLKEKHRLHRETGMRMKRGRK